MKILTRDDTDHNTEYVTRTDAESEIESLTYQRDKLRDILSIILKLCITKKDEPMLVAALEDGAMMLLSMKLPNEEPAAGTRQDNELARPCGPAAGLSAIAILAAIHQKATSALQTSWLYSGKEHVEKLMIRRFMSGQNAEAIRPESIKEGLVPPCPRCGYCGFIEDAAMNLAGVCPDCHGAGRAIIRHNATAQTPPDSGTKNHG